MVPNNYYTTIILQQEENGPPPTVGQDIFSIAAEKEKLGEISRRVDDKKAPGSDGVLNKAVKLTAKNLNCTWWKECFLLSRRGKLVLLLKSQKLLGVHCSYRAVF